MRMHTVKNTSWFSTLMALGTIGILLIIITGLATIYITEMKLSRASYDEIIAYENAEWVFEYGMLKVRNHREWFQDSLIPTDIDARMFDLSSSRSKNMKMGYKIESNATWAVFSLGQNEHLIIPLFAANEAYLAGSTTSKKPSENQSRRVVKDLVVNGLSDLTWTIVAMSGSESVWLSWKGNITSVTSWDIRKNWSDCYDIDGNLLPNCLWSYQESIDYLYDISKTVGDYLSDADIVDPYIMIYNPWASRDISFSVANDTPFTLPIMTIESTAQKNDSLQVFRFREDKSRYYDALKYGIYNKDN